MLSNLNGFLHHWNQYRHQNQTRHLRFGLVILVILVILML